MALWSIARELWKKRVATVNDDELAAFAFWLKYCPDPLDEIYSLLSKSIPFFKHYQERSAFLDYLEQNVGKYPKIVLQLLAESLTDLETTDPYFDGKEKIDEILKAVSEFSENQEVSELGKKVLELLITQGHHEFKKYIDRFAKEKKS